MISSGSSDSTYAKKFHINYLIIADQMLSNGMATPMLQSE